MRVPRISGVYAILGPNGVYVGESAHCWKRGTFALAVQLGLECGIVRETPGLSRLERIRQEAEVAQLFTARGLPIVSQYLVYAWPAQYKDLLSTKDRHYQPRLTWVETSDDRLVIHTTPRRAGAILAVLSGETLAAVGQRLGVSRERVRQYLASAGLKSQISVKWARAATKNDIDFHRRVANRHRRVETRHQRAEMIVRLLRAFASEHSRAPTYTELHRLVFHRAPKPNSAAPRLCAWLGSYTNVPDYLRRLHAAYRLAGLEPRKPGRAGHIIERTA